MRRPGRVRRGDPEGHGEHEPEARVVGGVAEQHDLTRAERVGGGEHAVHQCAPDAAPLVSGQHAERAEPQRGAVAEHGPAAHDVPDDLAVPLRDDREPGHDVAVVAQAVDERRLGGDVHARPGEGAGVHLVDGEAVGRQLATQDHGDTLHA